MWPRSIQRGLDNPEPENDDGVQTRDRGSENSVLGQFLFAALGSLSREARLAPNMVGTPGDIRRWMAYWAEGGRPWRGEPPKLARGWRADFVGRLFDDLLAGKIAVRVGDAKSEHPLVLE